MQLKGYVRYVIYTYIVINLNRLYHRLNGKLINIICHLKAPSRAFRTMAHDGPGLRQQPRPGAESQPLRDLGERLYRQREPPEL